MIIKTVLKKLREAELFEFLVRSSHDSTVQICRTLLRELSAEQSMTVRQLFHSSKQHDAKITMQDVERIVKSLEQAKVIVNDKGNLKFKDQLVIETNREPKPKSASSESNASSQRSGSSLSSDSDYESSSSDDLSTRPASDRSDSSSGSAEVQSSESDRDFLTGNGTSPLSSYFASVNSDLNDDYLRNNDHSQSSHQDHLVNRSNLDWLDAGSASDSLERSAKSSKQDNHLDFATTPTSSESSAVSSSSAKPARTSSQSSSLNSQSNSNRASQGRSHHSKHSGNRFRSIAKSLFQRVSFISLMSHSARIKQIAKAEFNLVVASRKYEGIKQADGLFKYEFKMNYQKFGKIGNRINNLLMKNISDHNN